MSVNPVNGVTQVNSQVDAVHAQSAANSTQNNSTIPEDTVTISPEAQALQTELKLAVAAASQNKLSPAAQELQTELKLAAAATAASALSPAAQAFQAEQKLAAASAAAA